jgi:predicted esterase
MTKFQLTLCLSGALVLGLAGAARAQNGPTDPYGGMEGRLFDAGGGFTLPYRLVRPPGYVATMKYPLVVFLHGSGESGTDNRLQISKNIGTNTPGSVFTTTANETKFPTFFIAPQTPTATIGWNSGSKSLVAALKLITALEAEFSIDTNRIYLTGLSLGGMGTYTAIQENPNLFAAAIPMSGHGDPTVAAKIAHIPIWDFHGAMDPSVDVAGSRDMIAALRAAGGMPRYTEYPNGMHDIWFMAYNTPDLLPWMNAQRLGVLDPDVDGGWPDAGGPKDAGVDMAAGGTGGSAAGASGGTAGASGATAGASGGSAGAGGSTAGAAGAGGSTSGGAAGTSGSAGAGAGGSGTAGQTASGAAGAPTGGHASSSSGCSVAGAGGSTLGLALVMGALGVARARRRRRA